MVVGIAGPCHFRCRVIYLLPERRQQVSPVHSVVEGPGNAALVKAHSTIILARNQVVRVGRVVNNFLFSLTAIGAVLVDAHIASRGAVAAADGVLHLSTRSQSIHVAYKRFFAAVYS